MCLSTTGRYFTSECLSIGHAVMRSPVCAEAVSGRLLERMSLARTNKGRLRILDGGRIKF